MRSKTDDFPYAKEQVSRANERLLARGRVFARTYSFVDSITARELTPIDLRFAPMGSPAVCESALVGDRISDLFVEDLRIRAHAQDMSIRDYWDAHPFAGARARDALREAIQLANQKSPGLVHADDSFDESIAHALCTLVRGRARVLNVYAAWGDRLIGFAAAGVRAIVDIDPDQSLGPRYAQIEEWLGEMQGNARVARAYFAQDPLTVPSGDILRALMHLCSGAHARFDLAIIDPEARGRTANWQEIVPLATKCAQLLAPAGILAIAFDSYFVAREVSHAIAHARLLGPVACECGAGALARAKKWRLIWFWEIESSSQ